MWDMVILSKLNHHIPHPKGAKAPFSFFLHL